MSAFTHFLKEQLLSCPTKKYFHIDCPGCGFQRSIIALIEGDFTESFKLYPALLPLLCLWSALILHLIFKFKNGAFIIKYLFLFCVLIIAISYIVKIAHHKLIG